MHYKKTASDAPGIKTNYAIETIANETGTVTIPAGNDGVYYQNTGKLVFVTDHFSEYYVLADCEAVITSANVGYASIHDAVAAAAKMSSQVDNTVTLIRHVNLSQDLQLGTGERGVSLNLNGKTIDGDIYQVYTAGNGTTTIFGNGTIKNNNTVNNSNCAALYIPLGSTVVIDDVTLEGYYGVYVNGNLTIKKATINAVDCGIAANSSAQVNVGSATEHDITVTASNGNCISTQAAEGNTGMRVNVFGGTFTSAGLNWQMCPVYWASHGTLNVYGGTYTNRTSSTGAAGILQKNGTVNIHGGSFQAKDGIKIVAQSDSTEIITDISGGSFTGTRSGIYIDASNATYMGQLTSYSVCINDNDSCPIFKGDSDGAIYTKTEGLGSRTLMTISGGQFHGEDPSAYVINGYGCRLTSNGYFEVVTARDAGYKNGTVLPVGPIVSGNTWTVNPSNAQYTLDGAYGSINGKTIVFSPGTYPTIELARATKYAGSNTDYYIGPISAENEKTFEEFYAIKNSSTWSASAYYVRNIEDVTLRAESGVIIPNIVASSGHVYDECYDYVLDKAYTSGSAYYLSQKIKNVKIEGFNFTKMVEFATSSADTVIDGITFKKCTFTTGGTESSNGAGLRYYNEANNGKVKNLVVDTCTFTNCFQGVYTQQINGVTVVNSTFDTTGHNAIAIQTGGPQGGPVYIVNHGQVVIIENKCNYSVTHLMS